ncbi:MAG: hypothetical protein SOH69_06265 [Olsenella sp.]|jgi:hypothetical protein|nr:hypothetical protein [Atopobiaceae bacterium]MDY5004436.1 hypothetical protein [Atopobiaceae bacterium]
MDELHLLLEGILEVLQILVLLEGLVRSTIDLVEEVRRRKREHRH